MIEQTLTVTNTYLTYYLKCFFCIWRLMQFFLFTFESEIYIFQLQKNPTQSKLEDSVVEVVGPSVLHKYFSFYTHS